MNFRTRHLCEIQQIVDQRSHSLRRGADAMQMGLALLWKNLIAVFQKGLAESINAAQRRAQVMRNRIAKGLQFFVRSFQLSRADPYLMFSFLSFGDVANGARN